MHHEPVFCYLCVYSVFVKVFRDSVEEKHRIRKQYLTIFGHTVAGSSQFHTVSSKVEIKTRLNQH